MNYPIIKTDNYLLVVDDESEIKEGDFIYHKSHEFSRIKKCEEIEAKITYLEKWIQAEKESHIKIKNILK